MLIQLTLDKLQKLHLNGMARALEQQQIDPNIHSLAFEDRIGLIVDAEEASRATKSSKVDSKVLNHVLKPVWRISLEFLLGD